MSYKDQDAWLDAGEAHLKPVSSSITNKVIDAFPKEEHASLAAARKSMTTLRLVLRFLNCDLNTYKDAAKRIKAKAHAANARTYRLPHRADHKGPTRKLVLWWHDILPMVVTHVLALQQELQSATRTRHGHFPSGTVNGFDRARCIFPRFFTRVMKTTGKAAIGQNKIEAKNLGLDIQIAAEQRHLLIFVRCRRLRAQA